MDCKCRFEIIRLCFNTVSLYCQVCGLAPLDRLLVVLALPKAQGEGEEEEGEGEEGPERPQLMVFEKSGQEYELVSTDLLTIKWEFSVAFFHFFIFHFSATGRSFSLETQSSVLSYLPKFTKLQLLTPASTYILISWRSFSLPTRENILWMIVS